MYGTLTTGDRAAVEAVSQAVVRDAGLTLGALEFSVNWGRAFFELIDRCNGAAFRTLFVAECVSLRATVAHLGATIDPEPYVRQLQAYWQAPPLQPDAAEFLQRCPVPVCLVTNADRADVAAALRRHHLAPAALVTSEDVACYKPDPGIFSAALTQTGWRPTHVLHLGDSLHSDVAGAAAAGVFSGWINRAGRIFDVGTQRPDFEFPDLRSVLPILAGT